MPAGYNCRVTLWEIQFQDDEVGGALQTGTPLCKNQPARFGQRATDQQLLQQGLESEPSYFLVIQPYDLDIHQRNEVEIVGPNAHYFYGKRFRVLGEPVRPAFNATDPRAYMVLNLSRSDLSHSDQ